MDYTSLVADKSTPGSIRRWCNYAPLDAEQVLEEAQALLYQTLRVREMRTSFTLALAPGDFSAPVPEQFLDPISVRDITHNTGLRLTIEQNIEARRIYEDEAVIRSQPCLYAIYDGQFQFDCAVADATKMSVVGFCRDEVCKSNVQNFLTQRYPSLLRTACLVQAYDFMSNDAKYQSSLTMLSALIDKANAESDLSYRGVELQMEMD